MTSDGEKVRRGEGGFGGRKVVGGVGGRGGSGGSRGGRL